MGVSDGLDTVKVGFGNNPRIEFAKGPLAAESARVTEIRGFVYKPTRVH
jgi:hypothetical protein